jgi:hypothetical protein
MSIMLLCCRCYGARRRVCVICDIRLDLLKERLQEIAGRTILSIFGILEDELLLSAKCDASLIRSLVWLL